MSAKIIVLEHKEIEYLLELVLEHKEEGSYWGRKDYFIKRQNKVIEKLEMALNTKLKE